MTNKVVIICQVNKNTDISLRKRKDSNDIAGENIVLFNQSQLKYINKSKFLYGSLHKEGNRNIVKRKKVNLSTCTYRNIMDFANIFMSKSNSKINFIGPAYSKDKIITDFQTVVTGTIEDNEIDSPIITARREIDEEIGIIPKNIKLKNFRRVDDISVYTYLAVF